MVNTEKARGGAARMAATLAQTMHDQFGHVNVSFFHAADRDISAPFVGLKRPSSRPVNALISRLLGSTAVFDYGFAAEVLERASTADVLHIHNLHGYYLDYVRLLSGWRGRPIVWTWHDMWGATGRCAQAGASEGWRTGCSTCGHLDYYPAAWFDRAKHEFQVKQKLYETLQNLWIVTPSSWLREIAIERGFKAGSVTVIPNPVDLHLYQAIDKQVARTKLGLDAKAYYLAFVAADCSDERKGFKDFLKVLESTDAYGIAVGERPETGSDRLICAGKVIDAAQLSLYYSAADGYLLTSEAENYPNTVIESQACGTPVFAYGVGGVPSQMPPFWDGTVRPKDLTGLCQKIRRHMAQDGKQPSDVEKLRAYAREKWAPDNAAADYVDLYERAIQVCRQASNSK